MLLPCEGAAIGVEAFVEHASPTHISRAQSMPLYCFPLCNTKCILAPIVLIVSG